MNETFDAGDGNADTAAPIVGGRWFPEIKSLNHSLIQSLIQNVSTSPGVEKLRHALGMRKHFLFASTLSNKMRECLYEELLFPFKECGQCKHSHCHTQQ